MMIGRRFSQKKEWVWGGRRLFSFVVAAGGQDTPSASSSRVSPFLGSRSSSSVLYPPTSSPPFHSSILRNLTKCCYSTQAVVDPPVDGSVDGDHVEEFQPLCEVQSDKATIEITSRYKGKGSGNSLCWRNSFKDNLAKECGININDVCGTGKDGRVLKEDVFSYAAQKGIKMADHLIDEFLGRRENKSSTSASDGLYLEDKIIPLRGFQRAMVKSMMMAAKVPHFHYIEEINCEAMVDLKSSFQSQNCDPDIKHTFLPILIKTLSGALSKYPMMNSCYIEETQEVILRASIRQVPCYPLRNKDDAFETLLYGDIKELIKIPLPSPNLLGLIEQLTSFFRLEFEIICEIALTVGNHLQAKHQKFQGAWAINNCNRNTITNSKVTKLLG
ncbi:Peripheral subunit-binding domain [Dillenia turbinata]|uniref:Dihydrolipoamide acetyltransferase component of pyruvate dehydrogenase complex n=1 Tax=Dillenia turbinata TaxID=194707 RepID=A0AAN8VB67_9MAGN